MRNLRLYLLYSCINYECDNLITNLIYKGLFCSKYLNNRTELCVMIKYYPLFILRSCLILISAISKHSEEVQDRCELWIIKINHFLTGLIVWSQPSLERTTSPGSRYQAEVRARPGPTTCPSLYLARRVTRSGGETRGARWRRTVMVTARTNNAFIYRISMSTKTNLTKSDFWSSPLRSRAAR